MRGSRGRRRGRRKSKAARSKRSSASSSSSSKSSKSKSKRRSTAASKRRKVRSVAKAARAAKRAAKTSTSTSSSTSSSSKNKTKRKVNKLKLNKKDRQRQNQENAKKAFKKKNEQQKKTISASQSRKQVRQKTKEKIATRKKINTPSLSQIGKFTRNLRQPISALSDAGVRSFLGGPAKAIAQGLANSPHTSDFNKRTRDFSKMTPQQRRKYERLSAKTGRDYSIRNPTFRLNMGVDTLANFGGFADKGWYRALPKSIRSLKVDKQFYGNPMKKGWHSSQRTGRGQGLTAEAATRQQLAGLRADPSQDISMMYQNILGREADQEGLDYWTNEFRSGRQNMDDIRKQFVQSDEFGGRSTGDRSAALARLKERPPTQRGIEKGRPIGNDVIDVGGGGSGQINLDDFIGGAFIPRKNYKKSRVKGPEQDWLSSLYSRHNISGGKLDQEARDYWSNEAKTKGRKATARSIIGTSKASGTYGGKKKPKRINTGSKRRGGHPFSGHLGIGIAGSMSQGIRRRNSARRKVNLQNQGANRRHAKSVAAHIASIRGGTG